MLATNNKNALKFIGTFPQSWGGSSAILHYFSTDILFRNYAIVISPTQPNKAELGFDLEMILHTTTHPLHNISAVAYYILTKL